MTREVMQRRDTLLQRKHRTPHLRPQASHVLSQYAHLLDSLPDRDHWQRTSQIIRRCCSQLCPERACIHPSIKFALGRDHCAARLACWSSHRKPQLFFIALHRSNAFAQIVRNVFPPAQYVRRGTRSQIHNDPLTAGVILQNEGGAAFEPVKIFLSRILALILLQSCIRK